MKQMDIKNNESLIEYKGKLVAPYYSLKKYNKKLIERINNCDSDTIIVFGAGHCDLILEDQLRGITKNVIFYEPIESIYQSHCDLASTKILNNLYYTNYSSEKFDEFLEKNALTSKFIEVVSYGNYASIFKEEYSKLLKSIRDMVSRIITNEMTYIIHSRNFTKNIIMNLFTLECNGTINRLKNMFKGVPALIVSAGPSLEKNYDLIKKFNGIIFSGGRTYMKLLEDNISNVFYVSIDPHINVYKLVQDGMNKTKDGILFLTFEGSHDVGKNFLGKKVFVESTNIDFSRILKEKYDDLLNLGGSVANASVSIAEYIGCDPIVFIGQDLSVSEDKHHASFTVKDFDQKYSYKANYEINGFFGDKVKTTSSLKYFHWWFEKHISISKRKYFNCTEGGAYIEGCEHIAFNEYLKLQPNNYYDLKSTLDSVLEKNPFSIISIDISDFKMELKSLLKEVSYSIDLSIKIRDRFREGKCTEELVDRLNNHDKVINSFEIVNPFIEYLKSYMKTLHSNTIMNKNIGNEEYGYHYYSLLKVELENILEVLNEI